MIKPYVRLDCEINKDMLLSNVSVVLVNVADLTTVGHIAVVSDYSQAAFRTAVDAKLVGYSVIIGDVIPALCHIAAVIIDYVSLSAAQTRVNGKERVIFANAVCGKIYTLYLCAPLLFPHLFLVLEYSSPKFSQMNFFAVPRARAERLVESVRM